MSLPRIFLSHRQADSGDACHALACDIDNTNLAVTWLDRKADLVTKATMKAGVTGCSVFCFFLSPGVIESWFTQLEISTAIRLEKPIVVLIDEEPSSSAYVGEKGPMALFDLIAGKMNQDDELRVDGKTGSGEALFKAMGGKTTTYHRAGKARRQMIKEILQRGDVISELIVSPRGGDEGREELSNAELVLGHDMDSNLGLDQCAVLELELRVRGVAASTMDREDVSKEGINAPLLLYLTDGVFKCSQVVDTFRAAESQNRKVVMVWEGDGRVKGSLMNATNGTFNVVKVNEETEKAGLGNVMSKYQALQFGKETRERLLNAFIDGVIQQAGISLIQVPASVLKFELAKAKARELEPGTRDWVFERVDETFKTTNAKAFIFLSRAGMGKSVIAGGLAHRGSRLIASALGGGGVNPNATSIGALHFFLHSDPFARSVETCVRSLARQLCASVPGFRSQLPSTKEDIETLIKQTASLGPGPLLEQLILNPALALAQPPSKKIAILLDAMDECEDPGKLAQGLARVWSKMPDWLVLIATARPQDPIAKALAGFDPVKLEPSDADNVRDLRAFLTQRIVRQWGVPVENGLAGRVVDAAVARSEGVFLWLSFQERVMKDLAEDGNLTPESISQLPGGIEDTYEQYFDRLLKALGGNEAEYAKAVSLAVVVPRAPILESIWCRALGHAGVDAKEYLVKVRNPASQLLLFDNGVVRPPHKSMIDWLTGDAVKSAKGMGRLDLHVEAAKDHHLALANICESEYVSILPEAMWIGKEDPHPVARIQSLSLEQRFAVAHAAHHYLLSGNIQQARKWFVDDFDRVYWQLAVGVVDAGHAGINRVLQDVKALAAVTATKDPNLDLLVSVLELSTEAVFNDPRELGGQVLGRCGIPGRDAIPSTPGTSATLAQRGYKPGLLGTMMGKRRVSAVEARSATPGSPGSRAIPPRSPAKQSLYSLAREWVDRAVNNGGLSLLVPTEWFPALNEAGGALQKVVNVGTLAQAVDFSPDKKSFVTGDMVGEVRIWDKETCACTMTLEGHTRSLRAIVYSQDGKTLVTASSDQTARIWRVDTGECMKVLEGHNQSLLAAAISSDGKTIATGSEDQTIRIWRLDTGECIKVLEGHTSNVCAVGFSSDNNTLVSSSSDHTTRVWKLDTAECVKVLTGHTDAVIALAISRDGKTLVTGSSDRTVRLWRLDTGECFKVLEGHGNPVCAVVISQDGKTIVSGSCEKGMRVRVETVRVETGEYLLSVLDGHIKDISVVAISADGKYALTGSFDLTCRFWRLDNQEANATLEGHAAKVKAATALDDGKIIVTASNDQTARVWKVDTGECLLILEGHTDAVLSLASSKINGTSIIVTGSDDYTARVWRLENGECTKVLKGHTKPIWNVAISSRGQVATGSIDGTARVWSLETGECIKTLIMCADEVYFNAAVVFTPDGNMLIGNGDRKVLIWRVDTGECVHVIEGFEYSPDALTISTDGTKLLTDNLVWDLASGAFLSAEPSNIDFPGRIIERNRILPPGGVGATFDTAWLQCIQQGNSFILVQGKHFGVWEKRS